ncbi:MAG: SRPBCC family protein [Acidobacteriota bacterium]|nr:SRPBCC family protein [Acidobacteriota bacterium]
MTYRLECSLTLKLPLSEVFSFFEDPRNLGRITPPWLNFRILNPESLVMKAGAEIDYVIGWLGLPMKWKTVITGYDPPHRFIDEQARGPYALWRHEHTFEETPEGVVIRDRVDYRLPLGILGRIAHALLVRRQLEAIFRYRRKTIAAILAAPPAKSLARPSRPPESGPRETPLAEPSPVAPRPTCAAPRSTARFTGEMIN